MGGGRRGHGARCERELPRLPHLHLQKCVMTSAVLLSYAKILVRDDPYDYDVLFDLPNRRSGELRRSSLQGSSGQALRALRGLHAHREVARRRTHRCRCWRIRGIRLPWACAARARAAAERAEAGHGRAGRRVRHPRPRAQQHHRTERRKRLRGYVLDNLLGEPR